MPFMTQHRPRLVAWPLISLLLTCTSGMAASTDCNQQLTELRQQTDASIGDYDKLATQCRQHFGVQYNYAIQLMKNGRFADAEPVLANARSQLRTDAPEYLDVVGRQAQALWYQGKRGDALAYLDLLETMNKELPYPKWLDEFRRQADDEKDAEPLSGKELSQFRSLSRAISVESPAIDYHITFKVDSDKFTAEGRTLLDKVIASLSGLPGHIVVVGHTDTTGDASYNQALSLKRANAVKRAISAADPGLASRLAVEGHGEREPAYSENSEDDRQRNRRVEFVFRD